MLKVKPHNKHHAIKSVVFALEWTTPLTSNVFEAFQGSKLHLTLIDELPKMSSQTSFVVNIDNMGGGGMTGVAPQQITGISYERMMPNGEPEWSVHLQQNVILVICGDYSRWHDIWPKASRYLGMLLHYFQQKTSINTIGLQYTDEFSSIGKAGFSPAQIFSEESKFVSQNLLRQTGATHSHHGYFEMVEGNIKGRRLNNINVNVVEQPSQYVVQIVGSHKFTFLNALTGATSVMLGDQGIIGKTMRDLHVLNKSVVGDLLRADIKEAINFDAPSV